jgi:hypothetical protein
MTNKTNGKMNGEMSAEKFIETANDQAKKMYMQRIWEMSKDQIFHELMRVHGESSKLLAEATAEIIYLKSILDSPEDLDLDSRC